jgi:hypothetical protein
MNNMTVFDQIIIGNIVIKRNGARNLNPAAVSHAIQNVIENLCDPLGEVCEDNLDIKIDVREL